MTGLDFYQFNAQTFGASGAVNECLLYTDKIITAEFFRCLFTFTVGKRRWRDSRHCCKVSDEAAFCLIQRPYISKTLLTRRISPRGSP